MVRVGPVRSRLKTSGVPFVTFPAPSVQMGVMVFVPGTKGTLAVQVGAETSVADPVAPPPSALLHVTVETFEPPASVALKVTRMGVVWPIFGLVGLVMETAGGVWSQTTVSDWVAVLPAVSVTLTVITWVPTARFTPVMVQVPTP